MIQCNPRISSLRLRVQSGHGATIAAAVFCWCSDDLPRLSSAAAIVGNTAFWFRPWELEDNFSLSSSLLALINCLCLSGGDFRELLARCRILVSLWDNSASVVGRLSSSTDTFVEEPICVVQQTNPRLDMYVTDWKRSSETAFVLWHIWMQ